jgi:tetratricopeptide (TPR) repeat protein
MKAFLCHSSTDKEYVRTIARRLTRARVVFDEMHFLPGEDFRAAIGRGLDASSLFVFIVSRDSLDSVWCKHEIDEAERRRSKQALASALVIIIDSAISYGELPSWLRDGKAIIQTRPVLAAREVQAALLSTFAPELKNPFVGRESALAAFAASLLTAPEGTSSRVFAVHGLDGVGRRTFLARGLQDNLSLRLGPTIALDATRGLDDLFLWTLDETADIAGRSQIASESTRFRALQPSEQVAELATQLATISASGFVPCLVDEGGVLSDEGRYHTRYMELVSSLMARDDTHVAFLHRRRPDVSDLEGRVAISNLAVRPLERAPMRLLMQQLLRAKEIKASSNDVNEIVDFLDGYPPAAYMAVGFAERYGFQALLADKSVLVDFKARAFAKLIAALNLSDQSWLILQYLAGEQAVPLAALSAATELSTSDLVPTLRELIDLSLVVVIGDTFAMSSPIRTAVHRFKGRLPANAYARIAMALTSRFWSDAQASPTIEVVDATLHAVGRSGGGSLDQYADLVRPSTLHQMAKESYDRKEWSLAVAYADRTLEMDRSRSDAQVIKFKGLVRLEEWSAAEEVLAEIENRGDKKQFYLRGFYHWKRRDFEAAARSFQAALEVGDRANAVYRDYAEVLYRLGQYDRALSMIRTVQNRDPGNVYVLDLVTRIAIDGERFDEAEKAIEELERSDTERRFIHHRKSRLYLAQGLLDLALVEADEAAATGIAAFEAFAQRTNVLIMLGDFSAAETALEDLKQRFGNTRGDVQLGLRCKLLLRQNKWREAAVVWNSLADKALPVHRMMLRQLLTIKSEDPGLNQAEREAARREAETVQAQSQALILDDDVEPPLTSTVTQS